MLLRRFYDDRLAQASYLIGCQRIREALVVDPPRDFSAIVEAARAEGLRITRVTETHIHADFLSGARELAQATGAELLLSAEGGSDWQYGYASEVGATLLHDGDTIALGGVRVEVLAFRDATAQALLDAVFFGEADQTLDFRTFQDHIAPDCTSNLLFKGAVGGRSRSVYTGMIRVGKDGRGTNAFQTNRNVKLSDGAWAESVPNLVIENNDVSCSHASTVGPVDEEQRFYLESRGVPSEDAERLIVSGFFDEVLTRLPVGGLVPLLRLRVAAVDGPGQEPDADLAGHVPLDLEHLHDEGAGDGLVGDQLGGVLGQFLGLVPVFLISGFATLGLLGFMLYLTNQKMDAAEHAAEDAP